MSREIGLTTLFRDGGAGLFGEQLGVNRTEQFIRRSPTANMIQAEDKVAVVRFIGHGEHTASHIVAPCP